MTSYRGRFAPSPTGPLHFGSLFAALISYLDARKNNGTWLLRIEDIDPLREMEGAASRIIETLKAHHLHWDETLVYQSNRSAKYEALLSQLEEKEALFRCPCSRKYLNSHHGQHSDACQKQQPDMEEYALKFRKNDWPYSWKDSIQGLQTHKLEDDFVLKRKEGFYAYQLAVVCDDYLQGITHVVRGHDLLSSTPMQLALYQSLGIEPPVFSHFPVLCSNGQKLSKQNYAKAVEDSEAHANLLHALKLLGLDAATREKKIPDMLKVAIDLWSPKLISGLKELNSPV